MFSPPYSEHHYVVIGCKDKQTLAKKNPQWLAMIVCIMVWGDIVSHDSNRPTHNMDGVSLELHDLECKIWPMQNNYIIH